MRVPAQKLHRATLEAGAIFGFGKYEGVTVSDVIIRDPGYIIWVSAEIDWIDVPDDVYECATLALKTKAQGIARRKGPQGFGLDGYYDRAGDDRSDDIDPMEVPFGG